MATLVTRKQLVSATVQAHFTNGGKLKPTSVTIHGTGNRAKGANAAAHANLQSNGNSRTASWHWTVDDHEAVQSYPEDAKCWHAGTGLGNNSSIAVEHAMNADGNWQQTLGNGAQLVAQILQRHGLTANDVWRHNKWSGKHCPEWLMDDAKWAEYLSLVADALSALQRPTLPQAPEAIAKPPEPLETANWTLALQRGLNRVFPTYAQAAKRFGGNGKPLVEDGLQGVNTTAWIKEFQSRVGIKVDGLVGKETNFQLAMYGIHI